MSMQANRRALLAGAIVVATAAREALAQPRGGSRQTPPPAGHDMEHMDHSQHAAAGEMFALTPSEQTAVGALANCEVAGEVCLSHCLNLLSAGDVSVAACARSVRDMLAVCHATQKLIETHSTFAGQQLALCRSVCDACRSECAPHAPHHAACGACASACAAVIGAIDVLLG